MQFGTWGHGLLVNGMVNDAVAKFELDPEHDCSKCFSLDKMFL
jgi:hypothetical protein